MDTNTERKRRPDTTITEISSTTVYDPETVSKDVARADRPCPAGRVGGEMICITLHWNHTQMLRKAALSPKWQRPRAARICARCPTSWERYHKSSCMCVCVWCENWIGSQCLLQTSHQCNTRSTMGRGRRATHCRPRRPDNAKRLPIVK